MEPCSPAIAFLCLYGSAPACRRITEYRATMIIRYLESKRHYWQTMVVQSIGLLFCPANPPELLVSILLSCLSIWCRLDGLSAQTLLPRMGTLLQLRQQRQQASQASERLLLLSRLGV